MVVSCTCSFASDNQVANCNNIETWPALNRISGLCIFPIILPGRVRCHYFKDTLRSCDRIAMEFCTCRAITVEISGCVLNA